VCEFVNVVVSDEDRLADIGGMRRIAVFVFFSLFSLQIVNAANAQGEATSSWTPLGPAPIDQAGAGLRGFVLPVEDSAVTPAGRNRISIHTVAMNNFYREQTSDYLVTQRFETHTLALEYRRGFGSRRFPRSEIGGRVQLHQRDSGVLNGLILGIESFWASLTGYEASKNVLRTDDATRPPFGTSITRNGLPVYRGGDSGSGFGDVYLTAKAALVDSDPSTTASRLSARIGMNLAGSSPFTHGNFVGTGISFDKKLRPGLAAHADLRGTWVLDRVSVWNLPLQRFAYGFSLGPEFRLSANTSLALQIDGNSTPYSPTGTLAFDKGYGALSFALGHRFNAASRPVTAQLYMRENMNLPFRVRWNTDPDLSVGLKISLIPVP
jgi:hypothetical protein